MDDPKQLKHLIDGFHRMWDAFPGMARLIDKDSNVLAVNAFGIAAGHRKGEICSRIPSPENHRGCLKAKVLLTQKADMDRPSEDKLRIWVPIEGFPELVLHASITLPKTGEASRSSPEDRPEKMASADIDRA